MKTLGFPSKLVCLLLLMVGSASSQQITVQNDQSSHVVLSAADIAALPHTIVKVNGHDGTASYSGVPVSTLLEKAGITFGESLRGKRLASCLLVEAADGYRVVIACPNWTRVSRTKILLVDKRETHPLDDKDGPYRIVIPDEKRTARWMRQALRRVMTLSMRLSPTRTTTCAITSPRTTSSI
jgi:hypothetical protein